jgi:coenzyme F420 hydrogenase subunit beta
MIKNKLGSISSIYLSWASINNLRYNASSGGFIKSFLWCLLHTKAVDYVIITRTGDDKSPLKPEVIITNSVADITSSRTNSVYAPSNVLSVLDQIDNSKRYAIVALPCQVKKLRSLQSEGKYGNISIVISLFCNHMPKIEFTHGILSKLNVEPDNVSRIEYRGSGWPGKFTAQLKSGGSKSISGYWDNNLDNGLDMCRSCHELGKDADIIVGDPWNLGFEDHDTAGKSLVICKNVKSNTLVNSAIVKGFIRADTISYEKLMQSQGSHIREKLSRGKSKLAKFISIAIPDIIKIIKDGNMPTLRYIALYFAVKLPLMRKLISQYCVKNKQVLTYYWRENLMQINLGDYITDILCGAAGYKVINYSYAKLLGILDNYKSCLLMIGSELNKEMIDSLNIKRIDVYGQGKGHGSYFDIKAEPYRSKVNIIAVRGNHTIKQLGLDNNIPTGDAAFLMPYLFPLDITHNSKVLYVPHQINRINAKEILKQIIADEYVDIMCLRSQFWARVKRILSSAFVLTSSLHTSILCHAYKTPWALCLPAGSELNFPDKWIDFYDYIGCSMPDKIATGFDEGFEWWQSTGSKLKEPDIKNLMMASPKYD